MIDVHVKHPNATEPSKGTYYIVARNGLHMRMDTDWVDAVIPMKELQALEYEKPRAKILLPPINAEVFLQIYGFFRSVYLAHQTEAAVLLHHSREHGWAFTVPRQRVSRAQVRYEMTQRLDGYRCVGTMHSHGDLQAGHSNTDIHDEASFDGIHVTLGSLNEHPHLSMEAEIVLRGHRFPLPVEQLEGVIAPVQVPAKETFLKGMFRSRLYTVAENEVLKNWTVPQEWMNQVQVPVQYWPRPIKPIEPLPVSDPSTTPVSEEVLLLENKLQQWKSPDLVYADVSSEIEGTLHPHQDIPPEKGAIESPAQTLSPSKPPVENTPVVNTGFEKTPTTSEGFFTSLWRQLFPKPGNPESKECEEKK
ncbi:Mov34/MPN/PAD-1 family protein [Candidatus Uhrbacteria bacterium]|nr:Mov34/MPN/PAD-1 family protein [Candidatus Uhrbacteria bacterium]